ncbi:MAG: hypothetical protein QOG87_538 [Actinomycetota bacterium]|jgi:hypothetical protein
MARRIEIELTSSRDDGTWTWRAAGAKQPKGVLDAQLLPSGSKVGDVLRVDAEFEIEGISIINVLPSKEKHKEPQRIEIIGSGKPAPVGVTSQLTGKPDRGDRSGRPRRDGERPPRGDRPQRSGGGPPLDRGDRGDRPARDRTDRPPRERSAGPDRRREKPARAQSERPDAEQKPKPRKLSPGNAHRNAAVEALSPEQRAVAEQLLKGGVPAVRQAIETQNKAAREAGQPEINAEMLLNIAEDVFPALKAAEWLDRAEAAAEHVDEIGSRDLRSVVATADTAARAERGRELATLLREALDRRVGAERDRWLGDMTTALGEGRLVRALRISARAPDPATRVPADLAVKLTEAASTAMAPDASPERWVTLLEAVSASPVRRTVKPVGLPPEPGAELLEAAKKAAGRVPALAPMLGIPIPPPPGPARPVRRPPKPPRPKSGPKPVPPPPAAPPAAPAAEPAQPEPAPAPESAAPAAEPAQPERAPAPESAAPAAESPASEPVAIPEPEPATPPA